MIYALEHYYNQSLDCEKTAKEIITLRNHYIHSGYYIKNDCLKIRFTPKENKQNYSVDANVKWIYNQTLILYKTEYSTHSEPRRPALRATYSII